MTSPTSGPPEVISAVTRRGHRLYGQRNSVDPASPRAVLLHDEGADLDSLRWLRDGLARRGISVDEWDLPGHGLSEGDYEADCGDAIETIGAIADPEGDLGVAYVGVGRTCEHLLEAVPVEPASLTLIQPSGLAVPHRPGPRSRTPTLCLVDPTDDAANTAAAELSEQARAWFLQAFVHGYTTTPVAGRWQLHAESMTGRLILEQSWLWRQRRRRRSPGPSPMAVVPGDRRREEQRER